MTLRSLNQQLAQTLASYLPPAVAREIHRERSPLDRPRARSFAAAVLLTDISGFTALTERLGAAGPDGAEELTAILNRYFSRMIGLLEQEGGEVVQFSGDALIACFPAAGPAGLPEAVQRAWQAANAMAAAIDEFAAIATSAGPMALGMKIGIGAGQVAALSVGGIFNRWQYVIAGDPLRQVAEAEHQAQRGEILLSPEARALFPDRPLPPAPLPPLEWGELDAAALAALQTHMPGAITHRLVAGQDDWLSELRAMSVLFLGISGMGSELDHVQSCMLAFQETVYHYEGSINKLLVDDKGVIAIVLFGAPPMAHVDDPLRAVSCAGDLHRIGERLGLRIAIGITTGRLFAGSVGSPTRREYTVIGDVVNLAARLMGLAGRGNTVADHATYSATRGDLAWEPLPPQAVKGRVAPVRLYRPTGPRAARAAAGAPAIVGRVPERERLARRLDQAAAGATALLSIRGEAGMGKTRLLHELTQLVRGAGLVGLLGSGQAIERQTPYQGWREIFESYFDLETIAEPAARRAQVLDRLAQIAPAAGQASGSALAERAPLLNDLLDLGLPESKLTAALEPRLRQASLTALLIDLLERWARERPLVLVLEDAHWLDSLAWELALQVARGLAGLPVLLVLALRPLEEPGPDHPLEQIQALTGHETIELQPLSSEETAELAAARLGASSLDPTLAALFQGQAAGNPFVIEELALSLRETGAVSISDGRGSLADLPHALRLPDTVQGLVLSRIDRLPADQQLVIKVASVIGRLFGQQALQEVYPSQLREQALELHLDDLSRRELVEPVEPPGELYSHAFRQAIFQQVTYGTLLNAQRRQLHAAVARWYESRLPAQADLAATLAYHWRRAGDPARELHYTRLNARDLVASYANREALPALARALELATDPAERFELLWLRSQVHERLGDQPARQVDLGQIQALAEAQPDLGLQAQSANAWAAYYRDISDYPAALAAVERAAALAHQAGDAEREARSLTIHGQVLEYTGQFEAARARFEQALALYRRSDYRRGEANNLSSIGNVLRYIGEHRAAADYYRQALAIREAIGDRAGEVVSLNNLAQLSMLLGAADEAAAYQQRALALARAIGDRSGEALIRGTIGDIALIRGDYGAALEALGHAVRLCRAVGERRREASALNQLGMVWRDLGKAAEARGCFEQALATQRAIGDQSQAAYTCLNLGYVLLPDLAAARAHYDEALALARATGSRDAEAYAHSYRSALEARQADWPAAEAGYQAALAIWAELEMPAAAAEDLAALCEVAAAQGRPAEALALAEQAAAHIEQHGHDGMEFPLRAARACAATLAAAGQAERAERILHGARQLIFQRAAAITDLELRAAFVEASALASSSGEPNP